MKMEIKNSCFEYVHISLETYDCLNNQINTLSRLCAKKDEEKKEIEDKVTELTREIEVLKQEILLVVIGFVFVAEVLSVIIQVTYYKKTHKRIFKMAPLHHHFEMCGWSEEKVVTRFRLVGVILAILGLVLGVM